MGHQGQVQKPREVPRPRSLAATRLTAGIFFAACLNRSATFDGLSSLLSAATGDEWLPELLAAATAPRAASGSCSPEARVARARPAVHQPQNRHRSYQAPDDGALLVLQEEVGPQRQRRPVPAPSRRPAARVFDMLRPARRLRQTLAQRAGNHINRRVDLARVQLELKVAADVGLRSGTRIDLTCHWSTSAAATSSVQTPSSFKSVCVK